MYWQDRMLLSQQRLSEKSVNSIEKQLQKYYNKAMKRTIADFEATYDKLLASIEEDREITPADLYKLDKYWQMQGQLQKELQKLGDKEAALLSKQFTMHFQRAYELLSIPSETAYSTIDRALAQQMINQIWCADGLSWSQRIWSNTEKLAETLNEELISSVVAGRKTTDLKKMLQERFAVSYSQADSLVRTEIAHIQTQAATKRYEDAGISELQIWADEDERRCEHCGKLHEKRYKVGEAIPIPAHPRCRCCVVPVIE